MLVQRASALRLHARLCGFRQNIYRISRTVRRLSDEEIANLAITLIQQATYMLRRLIERQQQQFISEGGIREQMTRARLDYRNKLKR